MIAITPLFYQDLIKIKQPVSLKIALMLLEDIAVSEDEISATLRKNSKTVRKAAAVLEQNSIIKILRQKTSSEVYYCISNKYFHIESSCLTCKYMKEDEKLNRYECIKKGKICENKYTLGGYNINKFMNVNFQKVTVETFNRKVEKKQELGDTDKWTFKEFIAFYIETFRDCYPKLISPSPFEVKKNMQELIEIFRARNEDKWRRILRRYIIEIMGSYAKEGKVFTHFTMMNKPVMSTFLNTIGKRFDEVEFCVFRTLYCSFYKQGFKCTLPDGEKGCSKSIRNKMLRKYN